MTIMKMMITELSSSKFEWKYLRTTLLINDHDSDSNSESLNE